ncbi:hypothetical protein Agabi119p4_7655 [Agaricus bisporus var. burnettii]|uniref:A-kinase anchor protein 7-like phosphoesterase domain-containing protein n=1 Tax=Agaricus bisporus var. burnettii TaxID=192524 RepID=A0A8H7EZG7_AGABI|nr:hypothetical protein Agabi119p4_7655 [Agaricus bisporus var. burnettii]
MPPRRQVSASVPPRPTHFLALPLHNHPMLRNRVAAFQNSLFDRNGSTLVRGLDKSILVDPRRLHMTLGVMALDGETKDITSALELLESLRPALRAVLEERHSVKVEFKTAPEVLKTEKREGEIFANVLYLGVNEPSDETTRLKQVCDIIHNAFKTAGYITETRPLKLHCTLVNTNYRRPRRREAFSYDDIPATGEFGGYDVAGVEVWEMGSRTENNEYASCGGIRFG